MTLKPFTISLLFKHLMLSVALSGIRNVFWMINESVSEQMNDFPDSKMIILLWLWVTRREERIAVVQV